MFSPPKLSNPVARRWTPYIALGVSLMFTFLVTAYLLRVRDLRDQTRFERLASELESNIYSEVSTYIALLQAGEGFVDVHEASLTQRQFEQFVQALELNKQYPGVQGIAYSKRFANNNLGAKEKEIRARGVADFTIWPKTDEPFVHSIIFIEPMDRRNRAAVGYNMHSEPVRRRAMNHARDLGVPAITGRVTLVQEVDEKKQAGFLIYNPVFAGAPTSVAERRAQLLGFVYSPFRADDFFSAAHDQDLKSQLDFAVYVEYGGGEELLHDSAAFNQPITGHHEARVLSRKVELVAGPAWRLEFRTRPGFQSSLNREFAYGGLIVGLFFSCLIFLLTWSQSRGWQKAEQSANRLAISQQELSRKVDALEQAESHIKAAAGRFQILAEASRSFAEAPLDTRAVSKVATETVVKNLGDLSMAVLVSDAGDHLVLSAVSHRNQKGLEVFLPYVIDEPLPMDQAVFARVISENKTVFMPVADTDALKQLAGVRVHPLLDKVAIKSVMAVPMQLQGRTVGVLAALRHESSVPYNEEDFFILRELAARVALAVENAALYERAQKAIRLRDEFLSIASHELKTPLTPLQLQVQGFERMLAKAGKEPLDPKRLQRVAHATLRQVERLTTLINNLLDISRISAGHLAFEPENCDLTALVEETLDRLRIESDRLGVNIHVDAPSPVQGYWDPMRLEQVITNLVSNALKYGKGNPVSVTVSLRGGMAELTVADQGIGITPELRSKLFERFSRGVSGREISGLGLGLFIVKQIVDGHGGRIQVDGLPDGGTRFTVQLPLRPSFQSNNSPA